MSYYLKNNGPHSDSSWCPEQILKMLTDGQETREMNWVEIGLPKLIDEILEQYEFYKDSTNVDDRDLPSKQVIVGVLEDLIKICFPSYLDKKVVKTSNIKQFLDQSLTSIYHRLVDELNKSFKFVCRNIQPCPEDLCLRRAKLVAKEILEKIPDIRVLLKGDVQAAYDGDPAAKSTDEVILSYPCVLAISTYRIAHELYIREVPLIPRIMSEYAHSKTGIDIHPGAKIGTNFFIDHGTGVVIGETAEIGHNVKIYQSVTLGAKSFPKNERGQIIKGRKRHPTVGNNVVIYSGSTILGGQTSIGNNVVIGGNAWITSSIPAGTEVIIAPPKHHYTNS